MSIWASIGGAAGLGSLLGGLGSIGGAFGSSGGTKVHKVREASIDSLLWDPLMRARGYQTSKKTWQRAGVHPLISLGVNPHAPTTNVISGQDRDIGSALKGAGDALKGVSKAKHYANEARRQERADNLNEDLIRSQIYENNSRTARNNFALQSEMASAFSRGLQLENINKERHLGVFSDPTSKDLEVEGSTPFSYENVPGKNVYPSGGASGEALENIHGEIGSIPWQLEKAWHDVIRTMKMRAKETRAKIRAKYPKSRKRTRSGGRYKGSYPNY